MERHQQKGGPRRESNLMNTNTNRTSVRRRALGLLPARAVIYVRDAEQSPADCEEGTVSARSVWQREACEQFARRLGLRVVISFIERPTQGRGDRPALDVALRLADGRGAEYLIVHSLDQLDGGHKPPALIGLELGLANTELVVVEDEDPELASRAREVSR